MSYIDTFDHEFIGFFVNLPVYHPLVEQVTASDDLQDFNCNPQNLIIGGGGGEHKAVILKRPDAAVARFIGDWEDYMEETEPEKLADMSTMIKVWRETFLDVRYFVSEFEMFHFAGWNVDDYHDFYERCRSPLLAAPFNGERRLEEWLAANLGEFIFFSMPELVPELDEKLPGAREHVSSLYMNLLLPPPGYPIPFGRRLIDEKVVWGNRWWRETP